MITLLSVTAALAVITATFQAVGPLWASVLTLFILAVFAHVAGNAIGTKLRNEGSRPSRPSKHEQPCTASPHHFAPTTQLSRKKWIGLPTLIASMISALAGAVLGGGLLAKINWEAANVANLSLAAASCAVLGGLWGFWSCSFAKVFWQAWQEALRHESSGHNSATPGMDRLLRPKPPQDS